MGVEHFAAAFVPETHAFLKTGDAAGTRDKTTGNHCMVAYPPPAPQSGRNTARDRRFFPETVQGVCLARDFRCCNARLLAPQLPRTVPRGKRGDRRGGVDGCNVVVSASLASWEVRPLLLARIEKRGSAWSGEVCSSYLSVGCSRFCNIRRQVSKHEAVWTVHLSCAHWDMKDVQCTGLFVRGMIR